MRLAQGAKRALCNPVFSYQAANSGVQPEGAATSGRITANFLLGIKLGP